MADQDRAEWTRVVADFETSDLSQREYAKERMLSLSNLRYWIYRLRKESRPLVTEHGERSVNKAEQPERLTLKPVRVVASVPEARREGSGLLELDLPSGTRVRLVPGRHGPQLPANPGGGAVARDLAAAVRPDLHRDDAHRHEEVDRWPHGHRARGTARGRLLGATLRVRVEAMRPGEDPGLGQGRVRPLLGLIRFR